MKMMMIKGITLVGGMGLAGYFYFKKHPEVIRKVKNMIQESQKEMEEMKES